MILQATWFILVYVLLAGYAILDGADLGVGLLHLSARDDRQRRTLLQSIGPVWDGNEVWLLTAGGALFAAFPAVYATVFSGFYLALMLLLAALIGRAVALEFRSKIASPAWQRVWDAVFAGGSGVAALLVGVAFGNIVGGVPLSATGDYTGGFFSLLNPLALVIGLAVVAAFTLQGALWIVHKIEGPMHDSLVRRLPALWAAATVLLAAGAVAALVMRPFLREALAGSPLAWVLAAAAVGSLAAVRAFIRRQKYLAALAASSGAIGSMLGLAAACLFPRLVPSSTDLALSLTAANSSSTPGTLTAMLVIALVGMPLVLAYTIYVHRIFRGKVVVVDEGGY